MNKVKILLFAIGLVCLPAAPGLADQCAYITKDRALNAVSRLNTGQTIYLLCEPCGEKSATPTVIKSLAISTVDYEDFWQVKVNETGIDLAYVFVESGIDNRFINLAAIAGCTATKVSPILPRRYLFQSIVNLDKFES
jgi:hypothetical protein